MISVIPAIDIIAGRCVRLSQGDYARCTTYQADPQDMVRQYVDHGFDRIHVVDLDGAKASQPQNIATLERLASISGARIEWGGGIKTEQALGDIFNAGASYAVVGSIAAKQPDLMGRWIEKYGSEKMVLGADVSDGQIAINGWTATTTLSIDALIKQLLPHGLTQVICTDISRDGMFSGPALELYKKLLNSFPTMILTASGGISSAEDIRQLDAAGVQRVVVGKAIYEGRVSLDELASIHQSTKQ